MILVEYIKLYPSYLDLFLIRWIFFYYILRVARWRIFIPKIQIWVCFGKPCTRKCWYILIDIWYIYGNLVSSMALWYISWLFGIFSPFWYVVSRKIRQPCYIAEPVCILVLAMDCWTLTSRQCVFLHITNKVNPSLEKWSFEVYMYLSPIFVCCIKKNLATLLHSRASLPLT
jgi:hypothetical protein